MHGPLLAAADLRPGERVIDIGPGRGATSRAAATRVGPDGHVLAVELAPDLAAAGRSHPPVEGAAPIEWVVADAQSHPFPPGGADVVVSRFGVMFFADPAAAFANLRRAVRAGGRLAIATWQPTTVSPYHGRVIEVAGEAAALHGVELDLAGGSPVFSFGVEDDVRALLGEAGWDDLRFAPLRLPLHVGGPGTSPARAAELRCTVGPLARALADQRPAVADAVRSGIEAFFVTCWDGTGVRLDAAIAVVTARRV